MLIYCGERMKQFSIDKGVTISKTVIIHQLGIRKKLFNYQQHLVKGISEFSRINFFSLLFLRASEPLRD